MGFSEWTYLCGGKDAVLYNAAFKCTFAALILNYAPACTRAIGKFPDLFES